MPAKVEGLLDYGRLENVNLQPTSWKPSRAPRFSLDLFKPEFLALFSSSPKKTIRSTAWLDGLRGFAAFLVYLHHNQLWAHYLKGNLVFEGGYGYEGRHYFAALPFVRLFFSGGHFAVATFFVISGYVLSVKALTLIQKNQQGSAADNVASALFRRWLRLYIPIIGVTLFLITFRHATKIRVEMKELKSTYREELVNWYYTFKNFSFVFSDNVFPFTDLYSPHAWSIPVEFKGSIVVYTSLLAFSRCTKNARLWCETGLIFYFLYIADGWYGALFMAGMLLCDLELLSQNDQLPRFFTRLSSFKEFIFFHLLIIGLYLAGVPSLDSPNVDSLKLLTKTPGWVWLSRLKPQAVFDAKWFYLFWAATLVVASTPRLPLLRRFFETPVCQYLARISFALYLVHGLMIWIVGDRLFAASGLMRPAYKDNLPGWIGKFPLPKGGPMGLELAFWVPQFILIPANFYVAEIVTKVIDEPSVKLANWAYRRTMAPSQPTQPAHKRSFSSAC